MAKYKAGDLATMISDTPFTREMCLVFISDDEPENAHTINDSMRIGYLRNTSFGPIVNVLPVLEGIW